MGNFTVARVFSDNMVLQRNKNISVFGEGRDGTEIQSAVSFYREAALATARKNTRNFMRPRTK